jgi:hypothetical protein
LFDDVVLFVGLSVGFFSCCFFVVLRLRAVINNEFFDRASSDSSRDVLLFRGDRAVVASSLQAAGLCFRRIENRKLEACLLEKLRFFSCTNKWMR